jgi:hypothetical protein
VETCKFSACGDCWAKRDPCESCNAVFTSKACPRHSKCGECRGDVCDECSFFE